MIQILLTIPDNVVNDNGNKSILELLTDTYIAKEINYQILNANHGRLVDEEKVLSGLIFGKHIENSKCKEIREIFNNSVVIEADKEVENG